jgi:hypothetical protein
MCRDLVVFAAVPSGGFQETGGKFAAPDGRPRPFGTQLFEEDAELLAWMADSHAPAGEPWDVGSSLFPLPRCSGG